MKTTIAVALVAAAAVAAAQQPAPPVTAKAVQLPAPRTTGGKPLMDALAQRATSRAFAPDPLPLQTVSNLLWAADGVNRKESGKRTAPSARNWQEIDVIAVTKDGAFLYDAAANALTPIVSGDHRALTGQQDFVRDAPLTLVLVADPARMKGAAPEQLQAYAWGDAAFVSENVYLFCASEGLATGVRAMVDRAALAKALALPSDRIVVFAQSVGFPKT